MWHGCIIYPKVPRFRNRSLLPVKVWRILTKQGIAGVPCQRWSVLQSTSLRTWLAGKSRFTTLRGKKRLESAWCLVEREREILMLERQQRHPRVAPDTQWTECITSEGRIVPVPTTVCAVVMWARANLQLCASAMHVQDTSALAALLRFVGGDRWCVYCA